MEANSYPVIHDINVNYIFCHKRYKSQSKLNQVCKKHYFSMYQWNFSLNPPFLQDIRHQNSFSFPWAVFKFKGDLCNCKALHDLSCPWAYLSTQIFADQSMVPLGPCSPIHAVNCRGNSHSCLPWTSGLMGHSATFMLGLKTGVSFHFFHAILWQRIYSGTYLWLYLPWYGMWGFITSLGLLSKKRGKYPNLFSGFNTKLVSCPFTEILIWRVESMFCL